MRLLRLLLCTGVMCFTLAVGVVAETTVSCDPTPKIVSDTSPFTVNILVSDVTNLNGASITFSFDPAKMECTSVALGSFLSGAFTLGPAPTPAPGVGTIIIDQTILGGITKSGSGTLVVLTFVGLEPGVSAITLTNIKLRDGSNNPIAFTSEDGEVILETTVPITLSSFSARLSPTGDGVLLNWETVSEINNYGYWIQRRSPGMGDFVDLSGSFVAGQGTTLQPHQYSFCDETIPGSGQYEYRLKQVDLDGTEHYFAGVHVNVTLTSVTEEALHQFQLLQNYPNPFNPATSIRFSVEKTGQARLIVYNSLGEEVATLFDGPVDAGRYYSAVFDAAENSSGVYFYRLLTAERSDLRKMVLVK